MITGERVFPLQEINTTQLAANSAAEKTLRRAIVRLKNLFILRPRQAAL